MTATNRWDQLLAEHKAREQGTPSPTNGAIRPVDPSRANAYAAAALKDECAQLAAMAPDSGRNVALNQAAFRMGRHVGAGSIDADTVRTALERAAQQCRLPQNEIDTVLRDKADSGISKGQEHPRHPAPGQAVPDVTVLETSTDPDDATELALYRARLAATEVERQRASRTARRTLDAEEAATTFREPPHLPTLTDELAIPDEPVAYAVDQLLPVGGNVLLASQFKAGKTTLMNNLARAFADHEPFLGKFAVAPRTGRVGLCNYEVDERQYRSWLRSTGIHNTDNVAVLNLRGYRLPLTVPGVEDWVVNWLTDHQVTAWVLDPFARAFLGSGTSENDNMEVGAFLDTLDVIKKRAGVEELIMPTHTGRAVFEPGEEHARGATRLDDWADVRWLLTKDEDDVRFFRATGRDVELDEEKLTYHEATRALTFGGGDRGWERRRRLEEAVVAAVRTDPGLSTNRLRIAVRGIVGKAENTAIDAAAEGAVRGHLIRVEQVGQAQRHYPIELTPFLPGGAL